MNSKTVVIVVAVFVAAAVGLIGLLEHRRSQDLAARVQAAKARATPRAKQKWWSQVRNPADSDGASQGGGWAASDGAADAGNAPQSTEGAGTAQSQAAASTTSGTQAVVTEAMAREALPLVGTDDQADAIWAAAIRSPRLTAEVRVSLIRGLGETGFTYSQTITEDDLPLVEARIRLIESLAPKVTERTEMAAFADVYEKLTTAYDEIANQ